MLISDINFNDIVNYYTFFIRTEAHFLLKI